MLLGAVGATWGPAALAACLQTQAPTLAAGREAGVHAHRERECTLCSFPVWAWLHGRGGLGVASAALASVLFLMACMQAG